MWSPLVEMSDFCEWSSWKSGRKNNFIHLRTRWMCCTASFWSHWLPGATSRHMSRYCKNIGTVQCSCCILKPLSKAFWAFWFPHLHPACLQKAAAPAAQMAAVCMEDCGIADKACVQSSKSFLTSSSDACTLFCASLYTVTCCPDITSCSSYLEPVCFPRPCSPPPP